MAQRLKEVRKALGLNQKDFAKYLGITQSAYSMIENECCSLETEHIKVICSAFNVSEEWFMTGEGAMFLSAPFEKEVVNVFQRLSPAMQRFLLLMAKELLKTQQKTLPPK